jgi:FMN phosphatase YigB (HAD superfamily)
VRKIVTIKAVTFDLWDTMIADDTDEPKRHAKGMRSKAAERRHLVWQALNRHQPIGEEQAGLAYDVADAAFIRAWKGYSVTWTVEERIDIIVNGLNRNLPDENRQALVAALGRMEVDVAPDPVPGIGVALADLAERYALCVVSDTIVTPGAQLRALLDGHGLKRHFSGFAFSDEVGRSKPHWAMFEAAASQLGVGFTEMVHIGDRDHNDVKGPQALGMKAILFTGRRDDDRGITTADAVCADHTDLPAAVDALAG